MENILDRDITGKCTGECRNRALEGQEDRQRQIMADELDYAEDFPSASWARDRDVQPGVFGGHV